MKIIKEKRYHVTAFIHDKREESSFKNEEDMEAYCQQIECYEVFRKKFTWGGMNKDTFDIMYSFWDRIKVAMDESIKETSKVVAETKLVNGGSVKQIKEKIKKCGF